LKEGIVLRAVRGAYTVHAEGGIVQCSLRGNLKKNFQYNTSQSTARRVTQAKRPNVRDTVAVGDRIRFTEGPDETGVIEEVLPRASRFVRSGFRGQEHTLVCNLELLCIVFACSEPRPDPWKLDRFLAAAEAEELTPLIVANKADRVEAEEIPGIFAEWTAAGYAVLPTSVKTGEGIDALRERLNGRVSAFVGPSGVGKSSLLNVIQPGLNLKTGEIGYVTFKGRHTTTASQLIPLHSGGWVADTPGLRQFDLLEADRESLAECFPELRPHVGHCRFDNCRHETEPGCAIKEAVERGEFSERRYESFLTLARESETSKR
jgi:ribosome biogenesis GTPase